MKGVIKYLSIFDTEETHEYPWAKEDLIEQGVFESDERAEEVFINELLAMVDDFKELISYDISEYKMSIDEIYEVIKNDIQEEDTMHIDEAGYSSWFDFITDWGIIDLESELLEDLLIEKGEEHWEKLWRESH